MSDEGQREVLQAFEKANSSDWPCLLDQLRNRFEGGEIVDDLILSLTGIKSTEEQAKMQEKLRSGAYTAIECSGEPWFKTMRERRKKRTNKRKNRTRSSEESGL